MPLGQTKIYLYAKDVDMRKSFDGLHALIQSEFRRDVRHGDLFLFLNRRLDRIKLMHWDTDGLVIWMKRLERGTFQRPRCPPDAEHVVIDATDLAILLAGIELTSVKRRPRYALDASRAAHDASRSVTDGMLDGGSRAAREQTCS
jgi:transposase